jgi:chromosome partitioning protein
MSGSAGTQTLSAEGAPMSTVVAVLNQKGGAGKTTLATHLARALVLAGRRTLLVDSDPQGSARDWHAAGERELVPVVGLDRPSLDRALTSVMDGHEFVIVDGAPQAHDLAVAGIRAADVVLVPVQPSPYDVWAAADLVELIRARQEVTRGRPRAAFVVWRQAPRTRIAREVREALAGYGLPVFAAAAGQRVIYAESASRGSTALDLEPAGPAAAEVRDLAAELLAFIGTRSGARPRTRAREAAA